MAREFMRERAKNTQEVFLIILNKDSPPCDMTKNICRKKYEKSGKKEKKAFKMQMP